METDTQEIKTDAAVATPEVAAASTAPGTDSHRRSGGPQGRGSGDRRQRRPSSRPPRPRSEFEQKIINIRRVARVVSGGRRFSFSVSIIIGNKKGKVGVGVGKAGDTSLAIDKAVRDAKKKLITIPLSKESSIAHEVAAKFCASHVSLIPVKSRGLVAGSSVRSVLELAGVSNIIAKVHSGSKNGLNNARATIKALESLKA